MPHTWQVPHKYPESLSPPAAGVIHLEINQLSLPALRPSALPSPGMNGNGLTTSPPSGSWPPPPPPSLPLAPVAPETPPRMPPARGLGRWGLHPETGMAGPPCPRPLPRVPSHRPPRLSPLRQHPPAGLLLFAFLLNSARHCQAMVCCSLVRVAPGQRGWGLSHASLGKRLVRVALRARKE